MSYYIIKSGIFKSSSRQSFWHPEPVSWKTIFPWTDGRVGWGWFQDDSNALHLLCTLFLLLLHQLHLRSSGDRFFGVPCSRVFKANKRYEEFPVLRLVKTLKQNYWKFLYILLSLSHFWTRWLCFGYSVKCANEQQFLSRWPYICINTTSVYSDLVWTKRKIGIVNLESWKHILIGSFSTSYMWTCCFVFSETWKLLNHKNYLYLRKIVYLSISCLRR